MSNSRWERPLTGAPQERPEREPLNIVILGASFAGLSCAHNFLKGIEPQLGKGKSGPKYKVILIGQSTHLYWNISAPRALVSQKLIPHTSTFVPIEPGFERYSSDKFQFVNATAISVDPSAKNITVALVQKDGPGKRASTTSYNKRWSSGSRGEDAYCIPYHALIFATGTSAESPLLSLHGPHDKTIAALNAFHSRLPVAESIIIAGGGPSGVEAAGQLATYFNTTAKWPAPADVDYSGNYVRKYHPNLIMRGLLAPFRRNNQRRKSFSNSHSTVGKPKTITLISGSDRLLPRLDPKISAGAEAKLKKLGVHVIHNLRMISAQESPSGSTRCVLSDETIIAADLYIAATGVHPNTGYLPAQFLDASGYIITDPEYLRVYSAGDRVYAIGDCSNYSKNYVLDVYDAIPVLMHNLRNDLLAYEIAAANPYGGKEYELQALKDDDARYMQNPTDTQLIPITRYGGVGVFFGKPLPSIMVWALKGRDYKVRSAKVVAAEGYNPYAADRTFD